MYSIASWLQVQEATVWTGGHQLLSFSVLLPAPCERSLTSIHTFEQRVEIIRTGSLL